MIVVKKAGEQSKSQLRLSFYGIIHVNIASIGLATSHKINSIYYIQSSVNLLVAASRDNVYQSLLVIIEFHVLLAIYFNIV